MSKPKDIVKLTANLKLVGMDDVIPTLDNPRRVEKDDPKIAELARSIEETGLLQPVICRPHPTEKGKFDLRAGFRRFLAHKLLGAETILAIIRDMDDAMAMEVTVLENLQREQLTPLEESRGVQSLLDTGHDPARIAEDIGKSIAWVYRRASLTKLCPAMVEAINDPDSAWSQASASMLEAVARLPAERQIKIKKQEWAVRNGAAALAERIADEEHELSAAPWGLDDDTLENPVACSACMSRSSVQPFLFAEYAEGDNAHDRCLSPECWANKQKVFIERIVAEAEEKTGGKVLTVQGKNHHDDVPGALYQYQYEPAKKTTPGAKQAIVISGPNTGKTIWITTEKNAGGDEQKSKMPSLELRRKAWIIKHVEKALSTRDYTTDIAGLSYIAAIVAEVGTNERKTWAGIGTGDAWDRINKMESDGLDCIAEHLWSEVRPVLEKRLNYMTVSDCARQYAEALNQADLLGLGNESVLMKLATEALPGKGEKAETDAGKKQKRKGK